MKTNKCSFCEPIYLYENIPIVVDFIILKDYPTEAESKSGEADGNGRRLLLFIDLTRRAPPSRRSSTRLFAEYAYNYLQPNL